ncbi:DUF2339 domain-containing protein, partial [Sesbania bispinosa]
LGQIPPSLLHFHFPSKAEQNRRYSEQGETSPESVTAVRHWEVAAACESLWLPSIYGCSTVFGLLAREIPSLRLRSRYFMLIVGVVLPLAASGWFSLWWLALPACVEVAWCLLRRCSP